LVANQTAILVTYLPSLLLSNFVFPRENMPALLKMITYIIPATYYIDILNGLYLRKVALSYLWPSFLVLFLMFFFLSTLNILILKKEGL
jgi:ABC-2 type transport system permease protein